MIAIIESGSTKSDWVVLTHNKEEIFRTETIGFNPHFINKKALNQELKRNKELLNIKDSIQKIYFYGAGCACAKDKKIIKKGLALFCKNATISVEHDLLGAAYSAYFGEPAIICILGTGSNSCFFDGKKTREEIPSLGYVLGDYGSGNDLGKRLLRALIENKLEPDLKTELKNNYAVSVESILDNIYKKPFPNKYLASFSPFVHKHKNHPFIQKIIYDSIKTFFDVHIISYPEAATVKINFIGSIAHYYSDTIQTVASDMALNVGQIVSRPIDRLIDYHLKYML
jgi:glucosamine kinase